MVCLLCIQAFSCHKFNEAPMDVKHLCIFPLSQWPYLVNQDFKTVYHCQKPSEATNLGRFLITEKGSHENIIAF